MNQDSLSVGILKILISDNPSRKSSFWLVSHIYNKLRWQPVRYKGSKNIATIKEKLVNLVDQKLAFALVNGEYTISGKGTRLLNEIYYNEKLAVQKSEVI